MVIQLAMRHQFGIFMSGTLGPIIGGLDFLQSKSRHHHQGGGSKAQDDANCGP